MALYKFLNYFLIYYKRTRLFMHQTMRIIKNKNLRRKKILGANFIRQTSFHKFAEVHTCIHLCQKLDSSVSTSEKSKNIFLFVFISSFISLHRFHFIDYIWIYQSSIYHWCKFQTESNIRDTEVEQKFIKSSSEEYVTWCALSFDLLEILSENYKLSASIYLF